MRRSFVSMEVGWPRIDSTCFLAIPSVTSFTLAFVIFLSLQAVTRKRTAANQSRQARRETLWAVDMPMRGSLLRPEVCIFAIQFIILKSDQGEFLALFVAIGGLLV